MPTERKRAIVAQLEERISRSNLLILTDYRCLNVAEITELRRSVERAGAGYHVVKNTLLLLAFKEAGIEGLEPYLDGPVAVAFAYGDVIDATKAVTEYESRSPYLKVKAGWTEGRVLPRTELRVLATLPPRQVLLGQMVGTIRAPVVGVMNSVAGVLRKLLFVLNTRTEERTEAA
jgi:large subunit ribosomal protein L10